MPEEKVTISIVLRDQLSRPLGAIQKSLGGLFRALRSAGGRGLTILNRGLTSITNLLVQIPKLIGRVVSSIFSLRGALVGLLATGAIAVAVKGLQAIAAANDEIAKSSRALGFSVEQYTALGFAAQQSGFDIRRLQTGLRRFNRELGEFVRSGGATGQAARALGTLGITAGELTDQTGDLRSNAEILGLVADRLGTINNQQERINTLFQLFGRQSTDFFILLENGSEGIQNLIAEANQLGGVLSPEQAALAERVTDSFGRVSFAIRGIRNALLDQAGPALSTFLDTIAQGLARSVGLIERSADVIKAVFGVPGASVPEGFEEQRRQIEEAQTQIRAILVGTAETLVSIAFEAGIEIGVALGRGIIRGIIASVPAIAAIFRDLVGPTVLRGLIAPIGNFLSGVSGFLGDAEGDTPVGRLLSEYSRLTEEGVQGVEEFLQDSDLNQIITDTLNDLRVVLEDDGSSVITGFANLYEDTASIIVDTGQLLDTSVEQIKNALDIVFGKGEGELPPVEDRPSEEVNRLARAWEMLSAGFAEGATAATAAFRNLTTLGRGLGTTVVQGILDVSAALVDAAINARNFGQAFTQVAANLLQQIATLIIQFLTLRLVASFIPGFGAAAGVSGFFNFGGGGFSGGLAQGFQGGGRVGGSPPPTPTTDNIPARLQRDEFVQPRAATRYYGFRFMEAIRRRLIPAQAANALLAVGPGFAEGGLAGPTPGTSTSGAGQSGPGLSLAAVVANEGNLERLLSGGRGAMLAWMQENSSEINQLLGADGA